MRMRIILLLLLLVAFFPFSLHAQTPPDSAYTTRLIQVEGEPVTLSPDGQWIAGIREYETICIWDIVDLTPQCAPTGEQITAMSLTWAPDSTAVAFSTGSLMINAAESHIFTFDTTGALANLTRATFAAATPVSATPETNTEILRIIDVYPAWSPESTRIAFARSIIHLPLTGDPSSEGITLMQMSRTGDNVQHIASLTADPLAVIVGPSFWLPDDSLVVSVLIAASRTMHADRIDIATGEISRIAPDFDRVMVRDVSAHGERFSLTVIGDIGSEEALLDTTSGDLTELANYQPTPESVIYGPLGFSPAGDTVVYRAVIGQKLEPVVAIGLTDPLIVPLEDVTLVQGGERVLDWATNNTILVPYRSTTGDAALLITLP